MAQIFLTLIEHPILFGFLVLCFMGVLGMTYDFLLKMFKRKGIVGGDEEPPEESNMPAKPDSPDDTLNGKNTVPSDFAYYKWTAPVEGEDNDDCDNDIKEEE